MRRDSDEVPILDPELIKLLGCPLDEARSPLVQMGDYLVCESCKMGFPIVEGIPQLLPENGVPLDQIRKEISHGG